MFRLNHSLELGCPQDLVQTLSFCLDCTMTWAALTKKRRKNLSSPPALLGLALDTERGEDILSAASPSPRCFSERMRDYAG